MLNTNKLNAEQHKVVVSLCSDKPLSFDKIMLLLLDTERFDIAEILAESNRHIFAGFYMDTDTGELVTM